MPFQQFATIWVYPQKITPDSGSQLTGEAMNLWKLSRD